MQGRRIVGGLCLAATLLLWGTFVWLISPWRPYSVPNVQQIVQPYEMQEDSWPNLAERLQTEAAEDTGAVRTLSDEELLEKLGRYGCEVGLKPFGNKPEVLAEFLALEDELRAQGLYFVSSRALSAQALAFREGYRKNGSETALYSSVVIYDAFKDCYYVTGGGHLEQEDHFLSFGESGQCEVFLQFETASELQPQATSAFLYDLTGSPVVSGCADDFGRQRAGVQLEIPRNFPIEYFSIVTTVEKEFIEAGGSVFTGFLDAKGDDWYKNLDYRDGSFIYDTNAPKNVFVRCSCSLSYS